MVRAYSGTVGYFGSLLSDCSYNRTMGGNVSAMVTNEPGMKGDALVGLLSKCRGDVMASVPKAAESVIRSAMAINSIILGLDSATKLHSARSAIRGVNISETEGELRRYNLLLTIFSGDERLSRSSCTLVRSTGLIPSVTIVGGASLSGGLSVRCVDGGVGCVMCVSTVDNSNESRLAGTIRGVTKARGFGPDRNILSGRERQVTIGGTLRSIVRTVGTLGYNVAFSTMAISVRSTVSRLLRLANREADSRIIGEIFRGFYMKG